MHLYLRFSIVYLQQPIKNTSYLNTIKVLSRTLITVQCFATLTLLCPSFTIKMPPEEAKLMVCAGIAAIFKLAQLDRNKHINPL